MFVRKSTPVHKDRGSHFQQEMCCGLYKSYSVVVPNNGQPNSTPRGAVLAPFFLSVGQLGYLLIASASGAIALAKLTRKSYHGTNAGFRIDSEFECNMGNKVHAFSPCKYGMEI